MLRTIDRVVKWLEAFYKTADKPEYTNREASGLIRFARGIVNTYGPNPQVSLTPWDWYAYALPALGWFKDGDKFKVDTKHQLQPYKASAQLRAALVTMSSELDEAGVPFRAILDPRGSDTVFRGLAKEAWEVMKRLRKEGAQPPPLLEREWEPTEFEKAQKKLEDIKRLTELEQKLKAQPVGEPLPVSTEEDKPVTSGSGGAAMLLLLFALGSKKKKRRGKR